MKSIRRSPSSTNRAVNEAHTAAWQAALSYLEEEGCVLRRGAQGRFRERAVGFVEGFALTSGAMASTYNPHYQHLLVVGSNPEDMAQAAAECARIGGGFVVANRDVQRRTRA